MRSLRLRERLLLLTLLPAALLAIVVGAYFIHSGMRDLERELDQRGVAMASYLAPASEYGVISGHWASLQGMVQATLQQAGVKAVVIVGQDGKVLAVSGRVSLSSDILANGSELPAMVEESDTWLAFSAPIMRSLIENDDLFDISSGRKQDAMPQRIGQVFIEIDKGELLTGERRLILRGAGIVVVGLVLAGLLALRIAGAFTDPIVKLVAAVRAMAAGHFETRLTGSTADEFGELERGFNEMAVRVSEIHQTMQERIEQATAQLAYQARHDPLTGLINRRELEARLEQSIAAAQTGGEESSLLFIDLDHFKPINDACGHMAGDELLRQIARLLQGRMRSEDSLARLGGDEFCALLGNCQEEDAQRVANDMCALVKAHRFVWENRSFFIGASIGQARITRLTRNVAQILGQGDAACYTAKGRGRNQVHSFKQDDSPQRRHGEDMWRPRLERALTSNLFHFDGLRVEAQQAETKMAGMLMVRTWLHDQAGGQPIPAGTFMDAAERYELAHRVDLRSVEIACAYQAQWLKRSDAGARHLLLPLASATVRHSSTPYILEQILEQRVQDDSSLCLVLPEDVVIHYTDAAVRLTELARRYGCRIALGEFGRWLESSFHHLYAVHPDLVLITSNLTRDIARNRNALSLVRAIQEIVSEQRIETIAEAASEAGCNLRLQELGISYLRRADGLTLPPTSDAA
jgi:diguanylate cyclase (GGDEF)-like protein